MRPYVDLRRPLRRIARFLFPIALGFFCLVYGFFFALTAPYLVVPFTTPIVVLVLLSIWALPDAPHAPTKAMELCFAAVIISRVLWPNYLALQLPGLPWLTFLRLAGFPMAFLLLICLSTSEKFRADLYQALRGIPALVPSVVGLLAVDFLTIPFSKAPSGSLQMTLLEFVYMAAMIAIGAWVGRTPGRAKGYIELLLVLSIPIMAITVVEARVQEILWVGHIPSFLKVDDPTAVRILSAETRGATGLYRTKSTFSSALALSEYLALLTPFFIHAALRHKMVIVRVLAALALPASFYCIRATDARLGVVGFLVSVLLYVLLWGIGRFARSKSDLFGAAVVYGYPAIFAASGLAIISIHKLRVAVLGDGSQASSNAARQWQLAQGIPKILSNPIGHGLGQAGASLGYAPGDFISVDNYYLTATLDTGILGLILFVLPFAMVGYYSLRLSVRYPAMTTDPELSLLIPLSCSFAAFLVIKGVFSQTDNHMLVYAMLGIAAALVYRVRMALLAAEKSPTEVTASPRKTIAGHPGIRAPQPAVARASGSRLG